MLNQLIKDSECRIKNLQDQFDQVYMELEKERAHKEGLEEAKKAILDVGDIQEVRKQLAAIGKEY